MLVVVVGGGQTVVPPDLVEARGQPDIVVQRRQGPEDVYKRQNMLRVSDCPADALRNRQDILNLRLTSGRTAVHSDMLMWSPEERPEAAALQFASVLYGVPQISVRIKTLPPAHKQMLQYYMNFWMRYRETLLDLSLIHI